MIIFWVCWVKGSIKINFWFLENSKLHMWAAFVVCALFLLDWRRKIWGLGLYLSEYSILFPPEDHRSY